jgi:hypothetical protein
MMLGGLSSSRSVAMARVPCGELCVAKVTRNSVCGTFMSTELAKAA